ncbi:acyl-CoA N-acyltransferase [Nadsonia fulvescens var. elongata DSM 6958]|uniref:Histone acetyltransferase type B catalytic subunit n=1 Tax=Nadsonia fulvescens var. elongata DSM 6958 TaxID=857566 RepID=A0A1E3PHJ6_9ASCO|nr:acyl-CoA N-acyltransferase [Nadsonia fulvescens var. elongata DSM 6958]
MASVSTEDFPEEWTSDANEALRITLVDETSDYQPEFAPRFTYPIFGDAERIYGYKDIQLELQFDATHLLPFVKVSYESKLKSVDLDDPKDKLLAYLPKDTFFDETAWNQQRALESKTFIIPGELVSAFEHQDQHYTIHKTSLADTTTLTLLTRFQIFNLLFIEAGSYIDHTDDRWEIFLIYNETKFIGFCTVYPYFYFRDVPTHDLAEGYANTRNKISQFIVLPPFQGLGLGANLYKTVYENFLARDTVREVSVEDPCEAFDDLRDRCDLEMLAREGVFDSRKGFRVDKVGTQWIEAERLKWKIAQRQFERCIEMAFLHYNSPQDAQARKLLRLLIKRRVYARNKDLLVDLTDDERKDKLQDTYLRMLEDYQRIIQRVNFATYEVTEVIKDKSQKRSLGEGLFGIFKRAKN